MPPFSRPEMPFNPNIRDGLSTTGLAIDKTNWAQRLDALPYEAYARGDDRHHLHLRRAQDFQRRGKPSTHRHLDQILGLFAAGEMVGGLFYHNYASGTWADVRPVFGRRAGQSAAGYARGS